MTKSPHTGGERGIIPDWRAIGITRRLEVHGRWYHTAQNCPLTTGGPRWVLSQFLFEAI